MGDSDVRERTARPRQAGGPVAELVVSKLRGPLIRPGTVRRSRLVARLAGGDRCPVVSVAAPAGDGKTTLLSQWAEGNGQAFAWVSVDEADNDPKVLLSYVAEALDAVRPASSGYGRRICCSQGDLGVIQVGMIAALAADVGSGFGSRSWPGEPGCGVDGQPAVRILLQPGGLVPVRSQT